MSPPDHYVVYEGKTFDVEFYYTENWKMPAYEYYQNLSAEVQRRFLMIIEHFANAPLGTILPKAILNIEDKSEGVYAFKPFVHRFFSFFTKGRKVIILNAYQKHSQQMTKADKQILASAV